MNDLIARLESATGPSLELDGRIWCAVNGYRFAHWDGAGCAYYFDDGKVSGIRHAPASRVRPFSASLDAALTLVPEGWIWKLDGGNDSSYCLVGRPTAKGNFGFPHKYSGFNRTPALALCVAALRARQHKSEAA